MHRAFSKSASFGLLLLVPALAFAAGELNGKIRGSIVEQDTGLPVPGASITISGKALIGGAQTVQSGEDGTFMIVELPTGSYDVEIAYAGVKPIKRKVGVRQGETTPLDVQWSAELAEAEVTEIVEERHITRPDSTHTGTVLSFDQQKKVATQRTYTDVVQQVAGVKADRGLPVVKGSTRLNNRYLIDGMDITDSKTNNFATQLNFDSIGSLEVLTGGMEAQYNSLGGVINVNSNSGSDEFRLDTSFYLNNSVFTAQNTYGSNLWEHDLVFNDQKAGPTQSYNVTANVSGPIVKQKLWYGFSVEYQYLQSSIQPGPPITGLQHPSRQEHNLRPRLKLTWAPNAQNRITLSTSADPAIVANRDQTNNLPVTEYGQSQGGFFSVLQWDHFFSQYVSTNVQTGLNYNTVAQTPIGQWLGGSFLDYGPKDPRFSDKNYTYEAERPQHRNSQDGSVWYQGQTRISDQRYTLQLDPSIAVRGKALGEHDAKFGIQTRAVFLRFDSHVPGGASYSDRGGGLLEAGLCDPDTGVGCANTLLTKQPDFTTNQWGFGIGAFAQDRWKVLKRLTILPGIRFDYGITRNSQGQMVSSQFGIGPRLGFALDITGDQKTILTGYYGRANDTLNLLPVSRADPGQGVTEVQRWDPNANEGKGGFVLRNKSGGPEGIKLDPSGQPPHTDEITGTINREIFKDSLISLSYTYKKMSNIWSEVEINQIWDPSGTRVVGYVNGDPRTITMYTTPDQAYRIYHGVDVSVESRPTPNWDLYAGYTLSWNFGPGSDTVGGTVGGGNAFGNPRQTKFYDGYLPEDSRHNLKFRASYSIYGFSLGVNFNYSSGTPLTKLFYNAQTNGYSIRRSPQGTTTGSSANNPNAFAAFRTPDQLNISLRASYDFHELIKQHLLLIADVFNALNLDTPASGGLVAQDTQTFATINQFRVSPLRVQFAVRYTY